MVLFLFLCDVFVTPVLLLILLWKQEIAQQHVESEANLPRWDG